MQAPSLCTQPGTTETREGMVWTTISFAETAWELTICYETAVTLLLRKVLDKSDQAHAAIIALSGLLDEGCQVLIYA
jgi:hypothetical protein